MKKFTFYGLLVILSTVLFSSCIIKDDYHVTPDPAQPVGYRNVFNEDFNHNVNGWIINDPANNAYGSLYNGIYKLSYQNNNGGTYSTAISPGFNRNRNFLVQTSLKTDNAAGILIGTSAQHYGYSFFIDNQGYFAIYDEGTRSVAPRKLVDWQFSSAISKNGWNDIEVEQYNGYWYLYVNGTKLTSIASYNLNSSQAGYILVGNTTAYIDFLTVKW